MTENKFRAWDKRGRFFVNPDCMFINLSGVICAESEDDRTVCAFSDQNAFIIDQFTGCIDENGKEIYYRDIDKDNGPICYRSGCFGVYIDNDFYSMSEIECMPISIKIIGNMHENPELVSK